MRMQKRDVVKAVLDGKRPPYVPWSIGFTKEAAARLQLHCEPGAFETRVQNHFVRLGSDIGFFDDLGNDRVQDVFGVVWNRSIDKDIGIMEGRVLPEANMAGYRFPDPLDPRFFSGIPTMIDRFPDRFRVFQIGFSLYERGWTLRGMENLLMDFYDHPGFVHELFEAIADYNIAQVKEDRAGQGSPSIRHRCGVLRGRLGATAWSPDGTNPLASTDPSGAQADVRRSPRSGQIRDDPL